MIVLLEAVNDSQAPDNNLLAPSPTMDQHNSPSEIERILLFNRDVKTQDPTSSNLPTLERNTRFKHEASQTPVTGYVSSADSHYVVARLLFELGIWLYALFCSQQAIENYLKAYIKLSQMEPVLTHDLEELVGQCRLSSAPAPFINSPYIEIIAQRFNPYNEVARYPVQRKRPEGRTSVVFHPTDMHILDYFFFKIREIVQLPDNRNSFFKNNGHSMLNYFQIEHPEIYSMITKGNINF